MDTCPSKKKYAVTLFQQNNHFIASFPQTVLIFNNEAQCIAYSKDFIVTIVHATRTNTQLELSVFTYRTYFLMLIL